MDWHSSGITTSVLGALKRGLNPRAQELGIHICGGRGTHSRNTPQELRVIADKTGLDGDALVRTSRLAAKVDNNAIADGFQIYLHGFILATNGEWAIVQQGMNEGTRLARRYHWHSATVKDFTCEPHTGIVGPPSPKGLGGPGSVHLIQNLVDERAKPAQGALLAVANDNPQRTMTEVMKMRMPVHHDVRAKDVDLKRLGAVLAVSHDQELRDFASLLLLENVGPRTLQTLAMIAEVIHGTPTRFADPARFSFALGGKDRHPFPVPLKTYDESIAVLRRSLDAARVGDTDKIDGMKRLDKFVRAVEQTYSPMADFDAVIAREHAISKSLGGRSVSDDVPKNRRKAQLPLFSDE
jgi:uncharacterized protein